MGSSGFWQWLHLAFVFAGLTLLILAVCGAALYLFQSRQLKSHRPGRFFLQLPSLDALDRLHARTLLAGVGLFSLGLLSGALWAKSESKLPLLGKDPTVILSIAGCLLYWGLVVMRVSSIGRGRKIALGTLGAFSLLFLAVLNMHAVGLP